MTKPVGADGAIDLVAAINAKFGAGVTPEQNAVVQLYKAHGPHPDGIQRPDVFFERLGISRPPEEGNYFTDLASYLVQSEGIAEDDPRKKQVIDADLWRSVNGPWKRAELKEISGWLDANERSLNFVIEASRRPRYFLPIVLQDANGQVLVPERGLMGQFLAEAQVARELSRALVSRAMLQLGEGRAEAGWNDLLADYRLGRLLQQDASPMGAFVGMAVESMASAAVLIFLEHVSNDRDLLQQIVRDLENMPPLPVMADKVDLMERLMFIDMALLLAAELPQADGPFADYGGPVWEMLQQPWFPAFDWNTALRTGNKWYDRAVAAMREKEYPKCVAALDAFGEDLTMLTGTERVRERVQQMMKQEDSEAAVGKLVGEVLVIQHMPQVKTARQVEDHTVQRQRNLRIALALLLFRIEHNRYPAVLAELVPQYLTEVPGDLFSRQALKYTGNAQGCFLYSVGPNIMDDGGRSFTSQPAADDFVVKFGRTGAPAR